MNAALTRRRLSIGMLVARQGARLRKMRRAAGEASYRSALTSGVLAGTEHEHVLRGLVVDGIIDVGANRGQFSLVASEIFPGCPIIAIEPLPGPATIYRRVLASRAVLHECAVGRTEGELEIFETSDDDSSSLLQPGAAQIRLSAGSAVVAKRRVRVRTLDDLTSDLRATDVLLKLDVQGFEMEALAGAARLLTTQVRYVYVEASFTELYLGQGLAHEVIRFLDAQEFSLVSMANPTVSDGQVLQADFLFVHRRKGAAELSPEQAT
jgi:FkbM family methyltransferase